MQIQVATIQLIATAISRNCSSHFEQLELWPMNSELSRYAASMVPPYPLGFIHLDLDG